MSIKVLVSATLRIFTGRNTSFLLDANSVKGVLTSLTDEYPDFVKALYDENGYLRPFINIYVNEVNIKELQNFENVNVLMTHIGGYPGHYNPWLIPMFKKALEQADDPNQRIDLFVCGHSHILKVQYDSQYKFLTINPGAAGKQGWQPCQTLLRLTIDGSKIDNLEVIELEWK